MATYLEAIIRVLEDAGTSLNYGKIANRAFEQGLIPKTESMRSNVSKIITTHLDPPNQIFVKVGRGVYDLHPTYKKHNNGSKPTGTSMAPSMEYREYMYKTKNGTLVKGQINNRIKFMFCEKNKDLFISGLKGEKEITSALYVLFDKDAKNAYVGITRRGYRRITDHWKKKFTHVAILFSEAKWSTDLRTSLERDLTYFFNSLPWNTVNQVETIPLDESDMRAREELLPLLEQIAARTHSLIHYMSSLYPGTSEPSHVQAREKRPKSPVLWKGRNPKSPKPPKVSTDPAIRHCWIWSCPESSYHIIQNQKIWASRATLENISARVHPGNLVTFYVKEHKAFSGVYEFVGEWYRAPRIMWPDEIKKGSIIHTSQIRLRRMRDGRASLDPLKRRLGIFRKNTSGNAGHVLQSSGGYPGNHGRPIPESDMNIISESMRPTGTGEA